MRPPAAGAAEPAAEAGETADSGEGRLAGPDGETAPYDQLVIRRSFRKAAAELMQVSRRSTRGPRPIKNDPDLAPAVERGQVTVADADQVRDEPAEV